MVLGSHLLCGPVCLQRGDLVPCCIRMPPNLKQFIPWIAHRYENVRVTHIYDNCVVSMVTKATYTTLVACPWLLMPHVRQLSRVHGC